MGVCFGHSKSIRKKHAQIPVISVLPPEKPSHNETAYSICEQLRPCHVNTKLNWKRGKMIGKGAYGDVYECLNLDTGEIFVAKHVKFSGGPSQTDKETTQLNREISILKELSHRNIVRYLNTEAKPDGSAVDIFLEYVPGGSLRSLLKKFVKFDEPVVRKYTEHLLQGLAYLHSRGIVHKDIKCSNLLVANDGTVLLSDFGAAKKLEVAEAGNHILCNSLRGSPYWIAPEVASRVGHSYSADIWSVGCTVIEMLTGSPPWVEYSNNIKDVLKIIRNSSVPPSFPAGVTPACRDFLTCCLQIIPRLRSTSAELLNHPFIQGVAMPETEEELIANRSLGCVDMLVPLVGGYIMDDDEVETVLGRSSVLYQPLRRKSLSSEQAKRGKSLKIPTPLSVHKRSSRKNAVRGLAKGNVTGF